MAEIKETSRLASLSLNPEATSSVQRGRNDYSALGRLRTKPGRADSLATISMSCSDKIASWTLLGIQGALLSQLMKPVYLSSLVLGEVGESLKPAIMEECRRAFGTRVRPDIMLPSPFQQYQPSIQLTSIPFPFSRSQTRNNPATGAAPLTEAESKSWIAEASPEAEALVDGRKRGTSMKAKSITYRSRLSKAAFFDLHLDLETALEETPSADLTYFEAKQKGAAYQEAKAKLRGEGGCLAGWVISGQQWEGFYPSQADLNK